MLERKYAEGLAKLPDTIGFVPSRRCCSFLTKATDRERPAGGTAKSSRSTRREIAALNRALRQAPF